MDARVKHGHDGEGSVIDAVLRMLTEEGFIMSTLLEYNGYFGSVEVSEEDKVLHGRLEFIRDLVTFEGVDAKGLKNAFHEAVDDYLELCEEQNRKPART